jgi:hypothetical protein
MRLRTDDRATWKGSATMNQLTAKQLTFYRENGYVFLPDIFPDVFFVVVRVV